MCLNPSLSNKHSKPPHMAILKSWYGLQSNVALCLTQCRIRLSKFGVVFNTSSGQMQLSFSIVPRKYARLMSLSFTSNDKLANIMTETSTLLVESTNSSINDVCASRLCLALEQSHEHILNVLHRSLPVPQSNAIALIPAPSISSVSSSAWGLVTPPSQARDQHQIFRKISIVVILRILLALSRLILNQARFLVLHLLSHQLIILFRLFTKRIRNRSHQRWIVHIQQRGFQKLRVPQHSMHIRIHPISPKLPVHIFPK